MKISVLQRTVEQQSVCVCDLVKQTCQNYIWTM